MFMKDTETVITSEHYTHDFHNTQFHFQCFIFHCLDI